MDALIEQLPIGRLSKPEEVVSVVLWLCSPWASYMIGQAISVDGGFTISIKVRMVYKKGTPIMASLFVCI